MFRDAFKDFERDPFFNFGSSPFNNRDFFNSGADPFSRPQLAQGEKGSHSGPEKRWRDSNAVAPRRGHRERQVARPADVRRHSDSMAIPGFTFGQHFDQMFESMNRMMSEMTGRMSDMQQASNREDFDGNMYTHSSVYSYNSNGKEEPHVYQAMTETRAGPGGVRETRKAVKDSKSKDEKMSVGHHIGARGHTVERRRNAKVGDKQEDHFYSGIDESEGPDFDKEWHSRAAVLASRRHGNEPRAVGNGSRRREQRAIANSGADSRHRL